MEELSQEEYSKVVNKNPKSAMGAHMQQQESNAILLSITTYGRKDIIIWALKSKNSKY